MTKQLGLCCRLGLLMGCGWLMGCSDTVNCEERRSCEPAGSGDGGLGGMAGSTSASPDESAAGLGGSAGDDSVAPEVVSISPSDGTSGVVADAPIEIVFSEPMDEGSVASALSVSSLPASELNLAWGSDGRVVTVTPDSGLAYASGESRDATTAREYTVRVDTLAEDVAGNPLAEPTSARFTTLRRISETLLPTGVSSYTTYSPSVGSEPALCPTDDGDVQVGWWINQPSSGDRHVYVAYDVAAIGSAGGIHTVEKAAFRAEQLSPDAGFYPDGSVVLDKLAFGAIDEPSVLDLPVIENLGTLAAGPTASPTLNIASTLWSDWSDGNAEQLLRLSHDGEPDNGSNAFFSCDGFSLDVTYLVP